MRRLVLALLAALACAGALARDVRGIGLAELPAEARETLKLIDVGGAFPYRRDGVVFQNRERRLPEQPRGYYREYTVPTPGSSDRGARRIVAGDKPPLVFYYAADHYKSCCRIQR